VTDANEAASTRLVGDDIVFISRGHVSSSKYLIAGDAVTEVSSFTLAVEATHDIDASRPAAAAAIVHDALVHVSTTYTVN